MANKKNFWGMLVVVLVFGVVLIGCDGEAKSDGETYTFNFKVDNNTSDIITKVDFINGDTQNDRILRTVTSIRAGERSMEYRVSGFTVDYGSSTRKYGIKVTYEDNSTAFAWSSAGHGSKILVSVNSNSYWYPISVSSGNW